VTVAVADWAGLASDTAVTEMTAGLGTLAGARYMASLPVPRTVVEIKPAGAFPPTTPLTSQLTAVLVVPLTVAVNGWVARVPA
jgi:hypothetical protein